MDKKNIIIIGAAGRDFHNFNTCYRNNESYEVVAFTAAQIPDIHGRKYPAELAGSLYPNGIPIHEQDRLPELIVEYKVDECVFSYSDISYEDVMGLSAIVNASGASFVLLGSKHTMIKSRKPVIAVCAARTGCGKSQTSRKVVDLLSSHGLRVVAIRHPMPYGDLAAQKIQRFASIEDLKKHKCTIEEMEEYEPYVSRGNVIYAGVDYEAILKAAEEDPKGCDIILWDGGNNDFPFYETDLFITVTDPHRVGDELSYYPGEVNMRMAQVVIINKIDSASPGDIQKLRENIRKVNPAAIVIDAASPIKVDNPEAIRGKRVLVVEDGPTLTHGGMKLGAGTLAAQKYGATEIIDPKGYAVGKIAETFRIYPQVEKLLPAMGYSEEQTSDLETTIDKADCDSVIIGTPIDLNRVIKIKKPNTRVYYELQEIGSPDLNQVLEEFVRNME
ncbi:MAG: GTPase [Clostridiales bacterium]|nr:GTPase [Clostridiales bacterium]